MRYWNLRIYRRLGASKKQAWGWTLRSPNGRIVAASSEGFATSRGARRNATRTCEGIYFALQQP